MIKETNGETKKETEDEFIERVLSGKFVFPSLDEHLVGTYVFFKSGQDEPEQRPDAMKMVAEHYDYPSWWDGPKNTTRTKPDYTIHSVVLSDLYWAWASCPCRNVPPKETLDLALKIGVALYDALVNKLITLDTLFHDRKKLENHFLLNIMCGGHVWACDELYNRKHHDNRYWNGGSPYIVLLCSHGKLNVLDAFFKKFSKYIRLDASDEDGGVILSIVDAGPQFLNVYLEWRYAMPWSTYRSSKGEFFRIEDCLSVAVPTVEKGHFHCFEMLVNQARDFPRKYRKDYQILLVACLESKITGKDAAFYNLLISKWGVSESTLIRLVRQLHRSLGLDDPSMERIKKILSTPLGVEPARKQPIIYNPSVISILEA